MSTFQTNRPDAMRGAVLRAAWLAAGVGVAWPLALAGAGALALAGEGALGADHPIAADAAFRSPPSFREDVLPVLTRFGCNMGGCHGKLAGQRGFRLSLRAYAPELDHEALTREARGRRLNPAAPELSLLLRKAVGDSPHGGGKRFEADSPAARVLAEWIRAGAPNSPADEPRVTRLEVLPAAETLTLGQTRRLRAVAWCATGAARDVTWLARFESTDPGALEVTNDGWVKALRPGETQVRVSFQEQVEIAAFTTPSGAAVDAAWYAQRNNLIDEHVLGKLEALGIEPAPLADDGVFLRRAYLDVLGVLPTPEETRAFLADAAPDKRARLADSLLRRPEYVDHWTLWLCDLLQNRRERDHDVRGVKGVRAFHAWMRTQVENNHSWKRIAVDVLTARGSVEEHPQVGYFVYTIGEREAAQSETVDSTAQAFLGVRVGCAKCHNHPLEKFTQDDYHHFAAFFSKAVLDRKPPDQGGAALKLGTRHTLNLEKQLAQEQEKLRKAQAELAAQDPQLAEAEKRVANLQEQLRAALRAPPTAHQPRTNQHLPPRALDRSAIAIEPDADPRVALAAWMTDPANEYFAGNMVNRLWKHFFGVGLVEPVDDLRATNPPSNRALWNALVGEFVASGHDLKHLTRLIVRSRTYQLAADTRPTSAHDYRFYSRAYPRRLPAETLLDALCQATGAPEAFAGYPLGVRAAQLPDPGVESYFLTLFGRSERVTACACEREGDVNLSQLLHLQYGDTMRRKIQAPEGRLARLLAGQPDNDQVLDELWLATLCRLPSAAERELTRGFLAEGERAEVFQDVFWTLLNSKEFVFNR